MRTTQAIRFFGTQAALSRALGITTGAITQWGDTVPPFRQLQLEAVTGGALRASKGVFKRPRVSARA